MDDLKALLERTASTHKPADEALQRTLLQAERRRTRKRLVAGIVALAVAGVGIGTAVLAFRGSVLPSSPAGPCGTWIRRQGPPGGAYFTQSFALGPSGVWVVGADESQLHAWIGHWSGADWRVTPTPYLGTRYNHLSGISGTASNDLWATGIAYPGQSDRVSHPIALHWDGRSWTVAALPTVPGTQGALGPVAAVARNDVWAAGWSGDKGTHRSLIEHWDGHTWTLASIPNGADRYARLSSISALSARDVWAVGNDTRGYFSNTVLHWGGTAWKSIDVPPLRISTGDVGHRPLAQAVVALARDDVWIAATADETVREGNHLRNLGSSPYFVHWDGSRWTAQRGPMPKGTTVTLNGMGGRGRSVWAVGERQGGSPVSEPVIYALRNGAWELVPSPTIPPAPLHMDDFRRNQLFSVSVDPQGNALALGTYFTSKSQSELALVESYCPAP